MSEKKGWIDFRALQRSVRFVDVLALYNVQLRVRGDRAQGLCPLPGHKGQSRSLSFSADLAKGIWQCFGCSAKGNVIDFVACMEGLDQFSGKQIRKAAELLQEKLGLVVHQPSAIRLPPAEMDGAPKSQPSHLPILINAPLDFELKNLDFAHPYLIQRGFTPETIRHFGLGFCNRGLFKGRIVIPIHSPEGHLVGYAGRLVDDRAISKENPKYLLPPPRERDGKRYEFHKSVLLYNEHRIPKPVSDVIVVEGFASVWWLWQHSHKNVVAVMGDDCSQIQADLIVSSVEPGGRIWIWTDVDGAGESCAKRLLSRLSPTRFIRWVKPEKCKQPTDLSAHELDGALGL